MELDPTEELWDSVQDQDNKSRKRCALGPLDGRRLGGPEEEEDVALAAGPPALFSVLGAAVTHTHTRIPRGAAPSY